MFSALRKLTTRSSGDGSNGGSSVSATGGVQTMAASMQRRFARGVQYNSELQVSSRCAGHCKYFIV